MPRPAMKKTMRVQRCSSRPGIAGVLMQWDITKCVQSLRESDDRPSAVDSIQVWMARPNPSHNSIPMVGHYATAHRLGDPRLHQQCASTISLGRPAISSELSTIWRAVCPTSSGSLACVVVTGDVGSTQCRPSQGGCCAPGVVGSTCPGRARLGQQSDCHWKLFPPS